MCTKPVSYPYYRRYIDRRVYETNLLPILQEVCRYIDMYQTPYYRKHVDRCVYETSLLPILQEEHVCMCIQLRAISFIRYSIKCSESNSFSTLEIACDIVLLSRIDFLSADKKAYTSLTQLYLVLTTCACCLVSRAYPSSTRSWR